MLIAASHKSIIEKVFIELGLKPVYSQVYIELLNTEYTPNISYIAEKLSISRPKVYEVISELQRLGLVSENKQPAHPSKLSLLLEEKEKKTFTVQSQYKELIPELELQYEFLEKYPKAKVYEGVSAMSRLLLETLEEVEDEYLWLNESEELNTLFNPDYFYQIYSHERARKGVRVRVLSQHNNRTIQQYEKQAAEELREVKFLPPDMRNPGTITLYNSKIILWNTETPRAFVISDAFLHNALKSVFELLWRNTKVLT